MGTESQIPARPDPEALLTALKKEEEQGKKAKLKIFFGMSAGVGKTYDMLREAHAAKAKGTDVVIGIVETHRRAETEALVAGLGIVPRRTIEYKGALLEEMDLDAILERKPQLALVDELAHTNAPGSRHAKRYQDVEELLEHGIDVFTTLNVQHLESRADTVAQITGSTIRETVPDSIFEHADDIEIIDIPPDELLRRLADGKVYSAERSKQAIENFFRKGNLTALREMSLRLTAERVDHQLREYMKEQRISGPWKSGQRLLVALSASPHSISLIRWARRMAYTMDASWIAVYVERSKPPSEADKNQLLKNIKLARELGAEIITTADENVAEALVRVARQQNASQILVGKPLRTIPFRKTLLEGVVRLSGDLDVYVIGSEEQAETARSFRLPTSQSGLAQYASAIAAVCVVALLCYPVSTFLGYQSVSLILLLTVALLPLKFGAGPVVSAAAASALIWDFFFIPPRFTFVVDRGQDILMLVMYFVISAVTGTLTARIRAREKSVRQREERAVALYNLTGDLSKAGTQDDVAGSAVANIRRVFGGEAAIFLSQPDGDIFTAAHPASTFDVDVKEFGVASWVYWNEKAAGRFTDTLPFAKATYYPVTGPRYPLGVVGIKLANDERLTIEQEALLQNFVRQIASTLEREQLNEIAKKSISFVESERLYKTLFDSLSHELRTPISAIVSASEGLLDEKTSRVAEVRKSLTREIHTAADRLNRLVGNLLDMARLESGRISPALDWCDLGDLFGSALGKLKAELSGHYVSVEVPPGMPLVKLDFGLIEQVIANLLVNASQYSPAGSRIHMKTSHESEHCLIVIADDGPGFPAAALPHLFEKFYRIPGTKMGGAGLGLSIAKGFVEAHHGSIIAENVPAGGARFVIRLPMPDTEKGMVSPG